jgi:hypothetical protein
MFDDLPDAPVPVLFWILEQFAELGITQPFPDHRRPGWRKVPAGRSGRHMRARKVMILVTGAAVNRIHSPPTGPAPHLHLMLVAIVSLAREVSSGVAIHAARMA